MKSETKSLPRRFAAQFGLFVIVVVVIAGMLVAFRTRRLHPIAQKDQPGASKSQNSVPVQQRSAVSPLRGDFETNIQYVMNLLEHEHANKTLTSEEEQQLFFHLRSLGLLAHTNAIAFEYLEEGSEPSFWTSRRRWSSWRGNWSDSVLANYAIQGLGLTGRTNIIHVLENLASREDGIHPPRPILRGAIVTAVFYHQYRIAHNDKEVEDMLRNRESDLYEEWKRTSDGERWTAWFMKQ
jgi:hypothetical protein